MSRTQRVDVVASKRTSRRSQLAVEPLEGRALLATVNQVLVAEEYLLFQNQAATPSQIAYWSSQLDRGANPNAVGMAIANSVSYNANNAYLNYLGRTPTQTELGRFGRSFGAASSNRMDARILSSNEFYANAGGTNAGFLNALYGDVLGRSVDTGGENFWLNLLDSGVSRNRVAYAVLTSPEAIQTQVTNDYIRVLGRNPDNAGLTFWTDLGVANSSLNNQDFLVVLVNSAENLGVVQSAINANPGQSAQSIASSLI